VIRFRPNYNAIAAFTSYEQGTDGYKNKTVWRENRYRRLRKTSLFVVRCVPRDRAFRVRAEYKITPKHNTFLVMYMYTHVETRVSQVIFASRVTEIPIFLV